MIVTVGGAHGAQAYAVGADADAAPGTVRLVTEPIERSRPAVAA